VPDLGSPETMMMVSVFADFPNNFFNPKREPIALFPLAGFPGFVTALYRFPAARFHPPNQIFFFPLLFLKYGKISLPLIGCPPQPVRGTFIPYYPSLGAILNSCDIFSFARTAPGNAESVGDK
jgi:hypothetical protein